MDARVFILTKFCCNNIKWVTFSGHTVSLKSLASFCFWPAGGGGGWGLGLGVVCCVLNFDNYVMFT